jgi:hypothetical protein
VDDSTSATAGDDASATAIIAAKLLDMNSGLLMNFFIVISPRNFNYLAFLECGPNEHADLGRTEQGFADGS